MSKIVDPRLGNRFDFLFQVPLHVHQILLTGFSYKFLKFPWKRIRVLVKGFSICCWWPRTHFYGISEERENTIPSYARERSRAQEKPFWFECFSARTSWVPVCYAGKPHRTAWSISPVFDNQSARQTEIKRSCIYIRGILTNSSFSVDRAWLPPNVEGLNFVYLHFIYCLFDFWFTIPLKICIYIGGEYTNIVVIKALQSPICSSD